MMPRIPSLLAMALATGAIFVLSAPPAYANAPATNASIVQGDDGPTAKRILRYGNWRETSNVLYENEGYFRREQTFEQFVYFSDGSVTKRYRQITTHNFGAGRYQTVRTFY